MIETARFDTVDGFHGRRAELAILKASGSRDVGAGALLLARDATTIQIRVASIISHLKL